jgi:UDP-N-acetylmuramate-alanine ligase
VMLAELMRLKQGIAIAGTHGKTTTTSLVASVLAAGGLDPTFVIGGRLISAGANARLGTGDFIVAEADESDASFLNLFPVIEVITNIDADHMDTYGHDFARLKQAFIEFTHRLPFYGIAVLCVDDPNVKEILPFVSKPIIRYGFAADAQVRFQRYGEVPVASDGAAAGSYTLVDDYGHHPVEMAATVAAARGAFPGRRLVLAFQPHRFTRTRDCFEDFVKVLSTVDALVLTEVYSAGEAPIVAADGRALARALRVAGKVEPVFVDTVDEVPDALSTMVRDGDVVITMGAGSIGGVPGRLAQELKV